MGSNNPFSRAFSIRDKRRSPKRPSKEDLDFGGLFANEGSRKLSKDEEKKVEEFKTQLETVGRLQSTPEIRIEYLIRAKGVDGDLRKAHRLNKLFEDSVAGILKSPDLTIRMQGAENREKVTCWLDSLLFAMFAKADVFEPILCHQYEDEPRQRLTVVLRLWVNMLRTGRLITTDITRHLQEALSDCGWEDAARLRQQDVSEAFGFITDRLNLPLVTLKTDLFHSGREDKKDDHKFITERLLNVAIPEDAPPNGVVTLEQCLEEYFNNRVEVKRELERINTAKRHSTLSLDVEKSGAVHVEAVEIDSDSQANSPATAGFPDKQKRPTFMLRDRATSIFSDRQSVTRTRTGSNSLAKTHTGSASVASDRTRSDSIKKEVLMPAWQFLNLIPWYTDNSGDEKSQSANYFSSCRPMLGICLKRYKVSMNGATSRLNNKIDIPLEMASPHFADDDEDASANFKLVLQAVVCHRGTSINAGHYIALARMSTKIPDRRDSQSSTSESTRESSGDDIWLRMDDLANERVAAVDIMQALRDESPYLLFYRIQPVAAGDEVKITNIPQSESEAAFSSPEQTIDVSPERVRTSNDLSRGRPSVEISEIPIDTASATPSIAQSIRSSSNARPPRAEIILTAPVSPEDEEKGNPGSLSKQSSSGTTAASKSARQSSDSSDRRISSRIRSRLSRERPRPESMFVFNQNQLEPPEDLRAGGLRRGSEGDMAFKPSKPRERKSRLSRSRHGGNPEKRKSGMPDRDCILM